MRSLQRARLLKAGFICDEIMKERHHCKVKRCIIPHDVGNRAAPYLLHGRQERFLIWNSWHGGEVTSSRHKLTSSPFAAQERNICCRDGSEYNFYRGCTTAKRNLVRK